MSRLTARQKLAVRDSYWSDRRSDWELLWWMERLRRTEVTRAAISRLIKQGVMRAIVGDQEQAKELITKALPQDAAMMVLSTLAKRREPLARKPF